MGEQDRVRAAVDRLGQWAAELSWADVPRDVRLRLATILFDVVGVGVLGARQPAQRRLVDAWCPPPGPAPVLGAGRCTTVESAAWLNACAMVTLELDEGHKFAGGHPAAHGFPAVLALAAERGSTGADTAAALLVAYEVAARFGRATRLRQGAHPHGSWGVAGAAAGCARLLGLPADRIASAIDAGTGLPVAGHFDSALDGNPVRDAWMGASNTSGLAAARMALAGIARNTGTAGGSLGTLLGTLDPTLLDEQLGQRWDVELGYLKRHSSCSFTHAAVDAALAVRAARGVELTDALDQVDEVLVETHSLASGLDRTRWDSRLGAMFSIPFTVATALRYGRMDPAALGDAALTDPETRALARRVVVRTAADLDARLPEERPARVTVRWAGHRETAELPNPVGDAAHHPFSDDTLGALLTGLLGDAATVAHIRSFSTALPTLADAGDALRGLAAL